MPVTRSENIQAKPSMRSSMSRPSWGTQGTLARMTSSDLTSGSSDAMRTTQPSETKPASHASTFRALDGRNAAHRLPMKGRSRMSVRVIGTF
jgi:hypothetical protein